MALAPELGALRGDWLELAERLDDTSYFQTPDWVLAWWETVGGRPATRLAAWRGPSGRLEALVALSRSREPLRRRLPLPVPVYVNAGSGAAAADHCGWLVPPERRDEVAAWVSEAVGGSALLLRSADPAQDPPPLPAGARITEAIACPRMLVDAETRSPGFRRQLMRFTRRLEGAGVGFTWVPPGSVDERLLTALLDLHGRARATTSFGPDQLALHRRLAGRAEPGRGPAAVVARRADEIVGVLYGFRWKDTFAAYQSGWDPAWSGSSLGSVLVHQAILAAAADGARTFDFLRGTEPYKYRFGAVDRCDRTWLVPRGAAGRLLAVRRR